VALTFHLSLFPLSPFIRSKVNLFAIAIHSLDSLFTPGPQLVPVTLLTPTSLTHVAFFLRNPIVGPHPIHPLSWRSDNKKINPRALGVAIDTHDLLAHSCILW
jgi:hypothetical protein